MRFGILGHRGRIGSCLSALLQERGHEVVGAEAEDSWGAALAADFTISCLSAGLSVFAIREAKNGYADLCESLATAREAARLGATKRGPYLAGCGLAPGAVAVIAAHLIGTEADECTIYCGALPEDRGVGYQISWSAEGLVGIYSSPCWELNNGRIVRAVPLTAPETVFIDGEMLEAFRTAGGSGTLPFSYSGRVKRLVYKTLRYPGHLRAVTELLLASDPVMAFKQAFPPQGRDKVFIRIDVRSGSFLRRYEKVISAGDKWSAIQRATAEGALASLLAAQELTGYIRQEHIALPRWAMEAPTYF